MRATPTNRSVLRCGTVIDGSGSVAREDIALVVDGDRILSIEPWRDRADSDAESGNFRDLRGHTIVPGLIDAHAHLCLGAPGSAGWASAATDPIGIVAWGLASGVAALQTGITTIVDVGSHAGLALRVASLIDAGLAVGPRVMAAGAAITTTAGHGAEFGTPADSAAEIVHAVRTAVADGADVIKIMVTGGATDPSSNRRRAQYTQDELHAAIDDAHRLGKRVIGHANATEGITRAVRAGIDIVAHCNWLGTSPATVDVDMKTVEAMARQKVWIDLNVKGALRDLKGTDGAVLSWPDATPEPTTRWELLQPLRRRGVGLYLTSDAFGPSVGGFTQSLREGRMRWDLAAEELIALVSGEPARGLGLDDEVGTLAPGRVADMVVLRGDLRSDPDALIRPVSVYRGGVEVVAGGRLRPPAAALASSAEVAAQQDLLDAVFEQLV